MKKILIAILLSISTTCFAQEESTPDTTPVLSETPCFELPDTTDLPQFVVVYGDTVGILMTVNQLQRLDSDAELLRLFKQLDTLNSEAEYFYINIINNMEDKITLSQNKIMELMKLNGKQESMVETLKDKLKNTKKKLELTEEQRENDAIIIKTFEEDINKLKLKNILSFSSTGLLGAGLITVTVLYILK
jgi:hypothetical protein